MKKAIGILVILALFILIGFVLYKNKRSLEAEALAAEIKVDAVPVEVVTLQPEKLNQSFTGSGILSANRELMVIAETQGRVEKVYKQAGDKVDKGEIVIKVNDELLRAEFLATEANFQKAEKDLERFKRLSAGEAISTDQLEKVNLNYQAAKAKFLVSKKRLADTRIMAPFSGVVNMMMAEEGGMVGAGRPVFELVDLSRFKLKMSLTEDEVLKIDRVSSIEIIIRAMPDEVFEAKLLHTAVKANHALQYDVELAVDNANVSILKAGMLAQARFRMEGQQEVLAVSRQWMLDGERVFVIKDGVARLRSIVPGEAVEDRLIVKSGLSAGELVVSSGMVNLRDGQKVKISNLAQHDSE